MRCEASVGVRACTYVQRAACMRARGSDMFACVRLQSIFGCQSPGGEREGAGAWQAEGQT